MSHPAAKPFDPLAVPRYWAIRGMKWPDALREVTAWLHSDVREHIAAGIRIAYDMKLHPLYADIEATYWLWTPTHAARDADWLVRGQCVSTLAAVEAGDNKLFYHALTHAHSAENARPDNAALTRRLALMTLETRKVPDLLLLAQAAANDANPGVRVQAATILAAADPAGTLTALAAKLPEVKDEHADAFSKAAVAALRAGSTPVLDLVRPLLLRSTGALQRQLAYDLAAAWDLPQRMPLLRQAYDACTDPANRMAIATYLGTFGGNPERAWLVGKLPGVLPEEAFHIIQLVAAYEDRDLEPALRATTRQRGPDFEAHANDRLAHAQSAREERERTR